MRIYLDANVLFSASNSMSNIFRFIQQLHTNHELVTCDYAFAEAQKNLQLKRPQWLITFNEVIRAITVIPSRGLAEDVELVEKDRPILGAAIAYGCDFLSTGDKKDFGHLYEKNIAGVTVVDYLCLAERLLKAH